MNVLRCPKCGDDKMQLVSADGAIAWCYGALCTGTRYYLTPLGKYRLDKLHSTEHLKTTEAD